MLSRFFSNLTVLLLAAALVTLSLDLSPAVVTWLAVGTGSVILIVTAGAFLARTRGAVQRALDGPIAIVAAWMIVGSRTFAGMTVRWLTFGEAVVLAALAVAGMIVHEASSERALRRRLGDPRIGEHLVVHRQRIALPDSEG